MLFRRKMFKKRNSRKKRIIKLISIVLLSIGLLHFIDSSVTDIVAPSVVNNCESRINNIISIEVAEVLEKMQVSYNDLVLLEYNNGCISSLSLNSIYINKIKSELVHDIEIKLSENNVLITNVEIGNILNMGIFSNRGPTIPVKYNFHSSVNSNVNSAFEDAGVNQTRHKISLNIIINVYVCNFWSREYFKMETDYVLGDTVIVGDIPSVYGGTYGITSSEE